MWKTNPRSSHPRLFRPILVAESTHHMRVLFFFEVAVSNRPAAGPLLKWHGELKAALATIIQNGFVYPMQQCIFTGSTHCTKLDIRQKALLSVSKTTAMLLKIIIQEREKTLNDLKRHKNEQLPETIIQNKFIIFNVTPKNYRSFSATKLKGPHHKVEKRSF